MGQGDAEAGNWKALQKKGALVLLGQGDNAALLNARKDGQGGSGKITSADRTQLYRILGARYTQEAIDNFKANNKDASLPSINFNDPKLADQSWSFVLANANPETVEMLGAQLELGENYLTDSYQPAAAARLAREQWDRSRPQKPLDMKNAEHVKLAKQLIEEAGGDKDRARELARRRGYTF